MHVRHTPGDGFPNPLVQLVFILVEPVTAKDIATSKRGWSRSPRVFADCWIVSSLGIPPGCIEDVGGVVDPLRAGLVMEFTQVFDGGGAKSCPAPGRFGFLLWLDQWVLDQLRSHMLGVAIPCVGK